MTNYSTPKLLSLIALALVCQIGSVQAQEVGKVISSTPVIQQVAVPRQVCTTEQIVVQGQKSGAGAAMGAIAGGAVGNSMGQGSGRAAATMLGLFGGAILGEKIEGPAGHHAGIIWWRHLGREDRGSCEPRSSPSSKLRPANRLRKPHHGLQRGL